MYSYIRGTLEEIREDTIIIDNQGIGYRICVPARIFDELPPPGSEMKIYTYLHVREDAMLLFGFPSQDEREMFEHLIAVSGIGPKGGLALLSVLSADDIRFAVLSEDAKTIAKAPGIGMKTAKKLIIELKDKVRLEDMLPESGMEEVMPVQSSFSLAKKEASEALTALGYTASDAARVIARIDLPEDADTEEILKEALKQLAFM